MNAFGRFLTLVALLCLALMSAVVPGNAEAGTMTSRELAPVSSYCCLPSHVSKVEALLGEHLLVGEKTPPRQMVARYFADLNAHRFYAAWLLEAPCGVTYSVPNGAASPGSASYPGKGPWVAPRDKYARHPILASAIVTHISRLHIPILDRNQILAFGVAGWFRFDYSAVASQPSFNNKHRSGFHVIKIAVWKCNGRWGVEPSYWLVAGGGELNWT